MCLMVEYYGQDPGVPVESAIGLLSYIQLLGEEGEWLPAPIKELLKDAIDSQVRCINRQACKYSSSGTSTGGVEECH